MKKLFFLLFAATLAFSCQQEKTMTLTGNLEGLQPGDTLILSSIKLPDWQEEYVDTFFATKQNELNYTKELPHTTFFMLTHFPKDAPRIESCIRGATFIAKAGDDINMEGSVYLLGALNKKGGYYNDSIIARLDSLENIYNLKLINIYNHIIKAREVNDQDSLMKYADLYNSSHSPEELRELKKYISNEINNSEFAAYLYLSRLYDVTATQLEERLSKFNSEVRGSYMGQRLESMMKVLKNTEPGNSPSDFTVIDMAGKKLKLSDYNNKYVLIYHWGMCPGTIWVHPKLLNLYENFHDKGFEVIGFTSHENFFEEYAQSVDSEDIGSLFNQPWRTVYTGDENNKFIKEDYYFSGVPILMLISPDGKTIFRGYTEVYEDIKKELENKLGQS